MNFLKRIFSNFDGFDTNVKLNEPNIKFGRYSDSFKNEKQVKYWETAISLFKEKKYIDAYSNFFKYLLDEDEKNVNVENIDNALNFEIFQGSKKVVGSANTESVNAHVKLVKFTKTNVAFMRKLMEKNYQLRYSRFAIEDDIIFLKFSTSAIDASPEKLYYAFKEIAIQADKNDDLLIEEFSSIEPVENSHIKKYDQDRLKINIKWIRKFISTALEDVANLAAGTNDTDIGFVLLATAFKIDYLMKPEGKVMDILDRLLADYYKRNDNKNQQEKNADMIFKLKEILDLNDEQLKSELYQTTSTFGLGTPTSHKTINNFIESHSNDILQKSIELKNTKLVKYQCEYLIGFILYYYGIYKPTISYLEFGMRLLNLPFFEELGFENNFIIDEKLNKSEIKSRINFINNDYQGDFKAIQINSNSLNYESITKFMFNYFQEIKKLAYPN